MSRHLNFFDRTINYLLITHAHDDHFTGAIELIRRYKIKTGKQEFSLEVFVADSYFGSLINSTESTPEWVDISNLNNYDLLPNVEEIILVGAMFLDNK